MTKEIGTGTVNLSINLPIDERTELGKLAFAAGARSVGHFVRHLIVKGLESGDPEAARRLKEIRTRYYGATLLTVFIVSLAVHPGQDLRRCARRVRVEEIREEELLA